MIIAAARACERSGQSAPCVERFAAMSAQSTEPLCEENAEFDVVLMRKGITVSGLSDMSILEALEGMGYGAQCWCWEGLMRLPRDGRHRRNCRPSRRVLESTGSRRRQEDHYLCFEEPFAPLGTRSVTSADSTAPRLTATSSHDELEVACQRRAKRCQANRRCGHHLSQSIRGRTGSRRGEEFRKMMRFLRDTQQAPR